MGSKTVRRILLAVAGVVFLCSSAVVLPHRLDMRESARQSDSVAQAVVTPAPQDPRADISASSEEELPPPLPIQVDFDALKARYGDQIASRISGGFVPLLCVGKDIRQIIRRQSMD